MTDTFLLDNPQTVEMLQSMRRLMQWLDTLPPETRRRLLGALAECSSAIEDVVFRMVSIVEDPRATPRDRQRALAVITDTLLPDTEDKGQRGQAASCSPSDIHAADSQEADFADRLRRAMSDKCVTQQELAQRMGCSQPAVSQMLNRKCRPQKKTLFKLAEALQVSPQDLWQDLETTESLDAVVDFQQDGYVMTEAEARALGSDAVRNAPKVPVRRLPTRNADSEAE